MVFRSVDEARGFAIFLINERRRHQKDIQHIDRTLKTLCKVYGFILSELEREAEQIGWVDEERILQNA